MKIKFALALLHVAFCVAFDLTEFKMPLYILSAILTLIGIYDANPNFGFLEYTFITFINTFIKGFVLEMYLHNRHSLLDPKTIKFAFYVFISTLIFGNPWVIKAVSSLLKTRKTLKFGLTLSDKVSQCITLSACYHHVLSQPEPSLFELGVITTVGFSITNLVLFFSLLEEKSQKEAFSIVQQSVFDNFKMYLIGFLNVYVWHFYVKSNIGLKVNEINAVRTVVSLSFVIFYTILSILHTSHEGGKKKVEGKTKKE